MTHQNQIVIYQAPNGETQIDVRLEQDTVWLSQAQLVELLGKSKKTISEHINNVFREGELNRKGTVRKSQTVQIEGDRRVSRTIEYYKLDVIISVGYRVKSQQGTQFRIWANKILKDYLITGYAVNEQKLKASQEQFKSLQQSVRLLQNVVAQQSLSTDETRGLMQVVADYSTALELLDQYDHQRLSISDVPSKDINKLEYADAIAQVLAWRDKQQASMLFGNEKDQPFKSSLDTVYQTFDGVDLYPTIEEKAANLLYFVVKNHSFSDGNKRIAAGLFVYFLDMNRRLFDAHGRKIIADNALVAITIMIAESKTEEKDMMIKLIVNLMQTND